MMILRFTNKAFKKFSKKPQLIEVDKTEKDFGEWYVNTVDSVNKGNLFLAVMHAESLYTMLLPIEKNTDLTDFVHSVFASLLLRMLRLEVPRKSAEQILDSYNGHAIFAKTNSRSLVANLSVIIKDLEAVIEYSPKYVKGNELDLAGLENNINDSPRTLNGETIWPLKAFYNCIRNLCPELPLRRPLPLEYAHIRNPGKLMNIFEGRLSEKLTLKVTGSISGAEVLYSIEEMRIIREAAHDSQKQHSDIPEKIYTDLLRLLNFKIQELEEQQQSE